MTDLTNQLLIDAYKSIDSLLKAACKFEETDTPELSLAINLALHCRGDIWSALQPSEYSNGMINSEKD